VAFQVIFQKPVVFIIALLFFTTTIQCKQLQLHTILDAITGGTILISMDLFGIKTAIFTNFASLTSGANQELVDTNALSTKHSPVMKQTSRQRWQPSW